MRTIVLSAATALFGLFALSAQAATATSPTFNVAITLNSKCEITTAPTASFTYDAFQTTNATSPSSNFTLRCTNTLPITSIRLDNGAGGVAAAAAQLYTDQATNLQYTLTLSGAPASGTGANQTVTLDGVMPSGQAGTCSTATCTNATSTNRTRTITITY